MVAIWNSHLTICYMPSLTAIIVLIVVALALWWKLRCIWRGCTFDPQEKHDD
jgi:hypothetical protein